MTTVGNVFGCCVLIACIVGPACAAVRPPAVAGGFYPEDPEQLRDMVSKLLEAAPTVPEPAVAVVVPHAGYVYSGKTAAQGFAALKAAKPQRVLLLGPSHHSRFAGGALPSKSTTAFRTPLGQVALDMGALELLRSCSEFAGPASAHDPEHCLEVELPFLQVVAPTAKVVPVLVGADTDPTMTLRMARSLARLVEPGTVIVVSSDFTHHGRGYGWAPFAGHDKLPEELLELGRKTAHLVAGIDPRGFRYQVGVSGDTICGARPIEILLELLAHTFKGTGRVVDVTTSGHVVNDFTQSVTYASVVFAGSFAAWQDEPESTLQTLSSDQQAALLELARATLTTYLTHGPALAEWMDQHRHRQPLLAQAGAFVTLHNTGERIKRLGRLRACMGVIPAEQPLLDAVVRSSINAANDPRFPRLAESELDVVSLEISVLSPTHPVPGYRAIEVGTHGVLLSKQGRSAVFLPQVATEQGWDLATMLTQLSRKAGLSGDAWRHGATFDVFTAQVFGEHE